MPVQYGHALYYPHIYPRSRAWLRTAALYHDQITRIASNTFDTLDRRYGSKATMEDFDQLHQAGFIGQEPPEPALEDVAKEFRAFITTNWKHKNRHKLIHRALPGKPYTMYAGKIADDLLNELVAQGLAKRVEGMR
jgi:hypothetical protein